MTKEDLVKQVSSETGLTQADVKSVLDSTFGAIRKDVASGGRVHLPEIGSWNKKVRPARKGRDPRGGGEIMIAEKAVVKFTASKEFRELTEGKKTKAKKAAAKPAAKSAKAEKKTEETATA
jgi:DNA-binding protein HU-beta